ncbi:MAG: hypothetical protein ABIP59_03305 [Roseateles sp.]|uniref:hypothetical protein n=1 Tax=Roseateles sp. TaxID=1971397 RepID=UPI003266F4B8
MLPIDYLMPTAEAFREAGAKPSIVAFSIAALISWYRRRRAERMLIDDGQRELWLLLLCAGGFAFCINLLMGWSDFGRTKSPTVQFITQGALLSLFSAVTVELSHLFRVEGTRKFVIRLFPFVAIFHLALFFLEASGLITDGAGTFLGFFRSEGDVIERPSGLMSEPSYFGVFAGMFGFALIFDRSQHWAVRFVLPLLMSAAALWINAKTIVAVVGIQLLGVLWKNRRDIPVVAQSAVLGSFIAAAAFYITSMAAFDLEENLSSVMRIGSTMLGLNLAAEGYGWIGVGTGQFHFLYREAFAPDFLMFSKEALDQMDPSALGRASAYNIFVRLLVEGGLSSLLVFLIIVWRALVSATNYGGDHGRFAFLLILASLGFLLTQDTYFYPPLCLGLSLAFSLSSSERVSSEKRCELIPTP